MFWKTSDCDLGIEGCAIETEQVDDPSLDGESQTCHVVCCNVLRGNQFWNVNVSIENVIGERCGFVSRPEEFDWNTLFFDLFENLLHTLKVGSFSLGFTDRLVVDW